MFTFKYAKTSPQLFRSGLRALIACWRMQKTPKSESGTAWRRQFLHIPSSARTPIICYRCCYRCIMKSSPAADALSHQITDFCRPFAPVTCLSLTAAARLILCVFEVRINFQPWLSSSPSADYANRLQMVCFESCYFQHQDCFFWSLVHNHIYSHFCRPLMLELGIMETIVLKLFG